MCFRRDVGQRHGNVGSTSKPDVVFKSDIRRRIEVVNWLKMEVFLTSCSDQNTTSGFGCDLIENESFFDVLFWLKYDVEIWLWFDWKWKFFWRRVLTKIWRRVLVEIWLKMKVFLTSRSDQNMTSGFGYDLIENESFLDVVFWPKYDVEIWLWFDWKWKLFWRFVLTNIRCRVLVVIWLKMKVF